MIELADLRLIVQVLEGAAKVDPERALAYQHCAGFLRVEIMQREQEANANSNRR
jgi:hypothetical protein